MKETRKIIKREGKKRKKEMKSRKKERNEMNWIKWKKKERNKMKRETRQNASRNRSIYQHFPVDFFQRVFLFFFFCTQSYWIRIIFQLFYWPIHGLLATTTTPSLSRLGWNGKEKYPTFHKAPQHEPHHQMQFNVIPRKTPFAGILYLHEVLAARTGRLFSESIFHHSNAFFTPESL